MMLIKNIIIRFWAFLKPPPQIIVIMAHMRSGSSLLEHILSSNPEIFGAGEQSRIYTTNTDLKKCELFVRTTNNTFFKPFKYITDQVLHEKFTPNLNLLRNNAVKVVLLIRNPEETIASIEKLGGPFGINEHDEFNSSEYYVNRLEYLVNLSKQIPKKNQLFLTYEELVTDTEYTLKRLSAFLELKTALKKDYTIKNTTGKYGDTSNNIKKGTIIITEKKLLKLDSEIKIKLNKTFKDAYVFFKKVTPIND